MPADAVATAVRGADEITAAAKTAGVILTDSDKAALAKLGLEISKTQVISDAKSSGKTVTEYLRDCYHINSFDPLTEIWTDHGLFPISNLNIGDFVLSYDKATGQTGYYPVTAVHRNMDPVLTYLWVKNNATGAKEMITTTPEHPFYLAENVDGSSRPVPIGHADLSTRWVGAGHLKEGDRLRMADGSLGSVVNVTNVQETREMFNLTVDTAHTFFVGTNGWLVHNTGPGCSWTSPGGLLYDVGSKDGNRVQHIFQHLGENSAKKTHSVFNVDNSTDIVPLLDEAWQNPAKYIPNPKDPGAYVIPMGRVVGSNGETSIRIIVVPGTNKIISAYPIK